MSRASIKAFELANPVYRGAQVTFYTVVGGAKSSIKASLYAAATGVAQLTNPQKLDGHGKFRQPVYIDVPVIGTVEGMTVPTHDTGITAPAPTFRIAADGEVQYSFDGGVSWESTGDYFFRNRGDWAPATAYERNDVAVSGGASYVSLLDHVSTADFATDLAAGKWKLLFTVGVSSITYAQIQDVSATDRVLGRATAGAGVIEEIVCTAAARALLDDANAAAQRATLDVPSNAEALLDTIIDAKGDLIVGTAADTPARKAIGTDGTVLTADSAQADGLRYVGALRGALGGLALSNNVADATNDLDIAVGGAMSTDNSYWMTLASAFTKQLDAAWAVGTGAGMRATGVAIANGTYHIFLIGRPDTGVIDIAADTSATGANIAANTNAAYTKVRRIGSILRESGAIVAFSQNGDEFLRSTNASDVSVTNPGTSAVTRTLSVPVGVKVDALFVAAVGDNGGSATDFRAVFSSLDQSDQVPGLSTDSMGFFIASGANANCSATLRVRTNTSAQIRSRLSASGVNTSLNMATFGWIDMRGRND